MMQIYLDNNATTMPLPALEESWADICGCFSNPSSKHGAGFESRRRVERARESVARLVNASSSQIIFTSGGTESIATILEQPWDVVITSSVEHDAVLTAAVIAKRRGVRVLEVGVDVGGGLDEIALRRTLGQVFDTFPEAKVLVSLMLANNETGVIFPLSTLGAIVKGAGAYFHVDAVQCIGKIQVDVGVLQCDFLSISAHKFHGVKGVGALYCRKKDSLLPLIAGHQEGGVRGGTENVPGILAMEIAAADAGEYLGDMSRVGAMRDALERGICEGVSGAVVNGRGMRLPNTSNIMFPKKDGAMLVEALSRKGVCASAGAACSTGGAPSHVLRAMGRTIDEANSSLRFSLSRFTTEQDIEAAIEVVCQAVTDSIDVFSVNS